jgi:hypothetical protein
VLSLATVLSSTSFADDESQQKFFAGDGDELVLIEPILIGFEDAKGALMFTYALGIEQYEMLGFVHFAILVSIPVHYMAGAVALFRGSRCIFMA